MPARLDPQRHDHSAHAANHPHCTGARYASRKKAVLNEPVDALLPQTCRSRANELGRIVEAAFALIGFAQYDRQRPVAPGGTVVVLELAEVGQDFHPGILLPRQPCIDFLRIDQHDRPGATGQEAKDARIALRVVHLI